MKTKAIPEEYLDLLQKRAFGHLATLMPNGSPQVTPVWVDFDGTHVLVNSAVGRQKDRNLRRDGRVALIIRIVTSRCGGASCRSQRKTPMPALIVWLTSTWGWIDIQTAGQGKYESGTRFCPNASMRKGR